ncbi:zinc finger domain-containing protein [Leifsonia sp. P73]|uniref:zinc finger domain-containing protein n=1 Tax=Leifsonia sp. P73 TaxID=3423959 RepID=UPI003DA5A31D
MKATSVRCPRCGAGVGRPCYRPAQSHPERYRAARDIWLIRWAKKRALLEAAAEIQALHPGERKNSVEWLRARAETIGAEVTRA